MFTRNSLYRLLSYSIVGFAACQSPSPKDPAPIPPRAKKTMDTSMAGAFSPQSTYKFDSISIDTFFTSHAALSPYRADVEQFYKTRGYAFAWHESDGQIEQAGHLYNRIRNLANDGISGKLPYTSQLDSLMSPTYKAEPAAQLQAELLLTAMYFYFAERAWSGMNESQTRKMEWFLPRKRISYADWLQTYLRSPDSAIAKEPIYRQYFLLKQYLQKYVALQQQGDWPPLTTKQESYQRGDTGMFVQKLRQRLRILGDLKRQDSTSDLLDSATENAIRHFQHRLGMPENGRISKTLLTALSTPLQKWIDQVLVNMERSRWLPDIVQGDYLAINIPEFKLHMYRDDSLLWDMNVVVGQSVHKTVIFSGTLKNIVFSPYWNVPPDILKHEVLPGIKKNSNYLAAHHMEWNGGAVRQKPGSWNSLGGVKFLFPNSYNIYLHDTPAKSLFGENDRAFSHGCIRLAEPAKLAGYLLRNDPQWNAGKIAKAMHTGKENWITVKDPFRVFIVYFTAWVDRQGDVNFRNDIYGRDKRLIGLKDPVK